jgi:hypothetical protein
MRRFRNTPARNLTDAHPEFVAMAGASMTSRRFCQVSRQADQLIAVSALRRFESTSRCFEDPEDGDGAAEVPQSAAIGGNMLAMEGSDP